MYNDVTSISGGTYEKLRKRNGNTCTEKGAVAIATAPFVYRQSFDAFIILQKQLI